MTLEHDPPQMYYHVEFGRSIEQYERKMVSQKYGTLGTRPSVMGVADSLEYALPQMR